MFDRVPPPEPIKAGMGAPRRVLALLLLSPHAVYGLRPSCSGRRVAIKQAAAATVALATVCPVAAAPQRGAEDPYKMQLFDNKAVCARRTLLGACKEEGRGGSSGGGSDGGAEAVPAPKVLSAATAEPESELVQKLLARTKENADENARVVREKTLAAGMSGSYGPLATSVPVMRTDGSFDEISFSRFDKLKDRGNIVRSKTGLDVYIKGFNPDTPEPKQEKLLGIF